MCMWAALKKGSYSNGYTVIKSKSIFDLNVRISKIFQFTLAM